MIGNLDKSLGASKSFSGLKNNTKLRNPLTKISPPTFSVKNRSETGIPEYINQEIPVNYILDTIHENGIRTLTVGNFRNGRIPIDKMVKNDYLSKDLGGDAPYLMITASRALDKLMKLYEESKFDGKQPLFFTDGYRNLSRQIALRKKDRNAARAGKSNHGWGLAIDIHWGVTPAMSKNRSLIASAFRHPVYRWFFENAPKCGWINPSVLRDFKSTDEWWHWEYRSGNPNNPPLVARYLGDFSLEDLKNILDNGGKFEGAEYLQKPKNSAPGAIPSAKTISAPTKPNLSKFKNLNRSTLLPKLKQSIVKSSLPRPKL